MIKIYYDHDNNQFLTQEYLKPKGKQINGVLGKKEFFNKYQEYLELKNSFITRLNIINEKLKQELSDEQKEAYRTEGIDLFKQMNSIPVPRMPKLHKIKVRVIGYNEHNNTVVEPSDKIAKNILTKLGY